jgi:hypothetical protein
MRTMEQSPLASDGGEVCMGAGALPGIRLNLESVGRDGAELPFGVDLLSTHPGSPVEGQAMSKPTETATQWEGVPDSHNDD